MERNHLSDNLFFWCFLIPPYSIPDIMPKNKKYSDYVRPIIEQNNWNVFITITNDLFIKFDILNLHSDIEWYLQNEVKMVWIDESRFDISSICIDYINVFQLFIMSEYINHGHFGAFKINEITRNKLLRCKANPSEYENIDLNCDPYSNILSDARHWFIFLNEYSCHRISYEFWKYFYREYFISAIKKFLKIADKKLIRNSLARFVNSLFEYYKWNFWESFVLAWFYVESYYRKLWIRENWRPKKWISIHCILTDLKNKWIINISIYKNLIFLKNHRNKLAHDFQKVRVRSQTSQDIAYRCLLTCIILINKEFKLDIVFDSNVNLINYSHSIPYL